MAIREALWTGFHPCGSSHPHWIHLKLLRQVVLLLSQWRARLRCVTYLHQYFLSGIFFCLKRITRLLWVLFSFLPPFLFFLWSDFREVMKSLGTSISFFRISSRLRSSNSKLPTNVYFPSDKTDNRNVPTHCWTCLLKVVDTGRHSAPTCHQI